MSGSASAGFLFALALAALIPTGCHSAARGGADTSQGEFQTPIHVGANLSKAPAVGETAVLAFDVTADRAYADAEIGVELPPNLEFVQVPAGMRIASVPSSDRGEPVSRAAFHRALTASDPLRFEAIVRAVAPGPGQIRVRVTAPVTGGVEAGAADIFLTVGTTSATSHFGIEPASILSASPAP